MADKNVLSLQVSFKNETSENVYLNVQMYSECKNGDWTENWEVKDSTARNMCVMFCLGDCVILFKEDDGYLEQDLAEIEKETATLRTFIESERWGDVVGLIKESDFVRFLE